MRSLISMSAVVLAMSALSLSAQAKANTIDFGTASGCPLGTLLSARHQLIEASYGVDDVDLGLCHDGRFVRRPLRVTPEPVVPLFSI